ncbi:putative HxlR family transcriptional regulator [Gordonia effusa NBRC 100432]|uniref:Putative HxlR family transcriptional regulator n=1 Tax=Gordonia effusa NBRC 100432 TaxID=1077974 RepID=H0R014_9ACTN|nr:helix-turn-helix domain-containing protein [Gordonia effusa]GAB18415.1 putative HxlR family transcriptional regulator [Gordonia effusa NBRC 100432]
MRSARDSTEEEASAEAGIYAAMDLLGQRWVLRVIWELEPGPLGFLELRRRMGNCSSSVLADRLNVLSRAGIVEKLPDKAYELTAHRGGALGAALEGVWRWADVNAEALTGGPRRQEPGGAQNARRRS